VTGATADAVRLYDEGSALEATFVPAAGMVCSSLRHRGDELLAQNAGVSAYAERGKTMGIPLLYPWANRLSGFRYSVAGRTVDVPHDPTRVALDGDGLPIHGVIPGRLRWEPAQLPSAAAQSLSARLSWSESRAELFEVFPFRHEVLFEARLGAGRLEIDVTVSASGAEVVPVAFGFHPYLAPPGVPREQWLVELPAMHRLALDSHHIPSGPETAQPARSFALSEHEFDDGFDAVAEPARFRVTAGDRRLTLEFQRGYPCAQVFAPHASRFICFEPMTAPANALLTGAGLHLLAPGERYRAGFSLLVDDGTEPARSQPGRVPG
jgi:galactose mutarotase-like enzyme